MWRGSAQYESQSSSGVLQGQEDSDTDANESGLVLPLNPGCASMEPQMENQLEIQIPMCNSLYQCTSSSAHFSDGKLASLALHPTFSSYEFRNDGLASRKFSVPNVNSKERRTLEVMNENETSLRKPNGGRSRYMVFGVNLVNGPPELPSPQGLTSSEHCSIPPTSQSSVSEPSKGTSSKHCKNCCSVISNRSCTKVMLCFFSIIQPFFIFLLMQE